MKGLSVCVSLYLPLSLDLSLLSSFSNLKKVKLENCIFQCWKLGSLTPKDEQIQHPGRANFLLNSLLIKPRMREAGDLSQIS